jgi:LysR family glycine cleavage system transcriptional activator
MGAGVVMADFLLCRDELSAGALVLPFPDMVCESPYGAVSLLGLRDTWDSAKVRAFRDWALEEAQADVQALKALGMS